MELAGSCFRISGEKTSWRGDKQGNDIREKTCRGTVHELAAPGQEEKKKGDGIHYIA